MTASPESIAYAARRPASSRHFDVRGLRYHALQWGDESLITEDRPRLLMLHGWMDVAASFQFVVDALPDNRCILALDWRGFGGTEGPATDSYWFPDYLADLDAVLDQLPPGPPVDLLGHSMGGNVAMLYAGVRPQRLRRLVNLEGFGMPPQESRDAPRRYARWLDELQQPAELRLYADAASVAERLRKTNPLLAPERAAWLAQRWAAPGADGRWHLRADPVHKRVNPVLYRAAEATECWKRITAPVLWVEGDRTDILRRWGTPNARADFEARLAVVARLERHVVGPAGHMLHHDQPEALAQHLDAFLG